MAKQLSLRLPDELHDQLKAAAEHHRRSLHADILRRLERDLKGDPKRDEEQAYGAPIQYASTAGAAAAAPRTCSCGITVMSTAGCETSRVPHWQAHLAFH